MLLTVNCCSSMRRIVRHVQGCHTVVEHLAAHFPSRLQQLDSAMQVFPNVKVPPQQTAEHYSACAMKGLAVKPAAGSAVAFWSLQTDGRLDSGALHGGCPVLKGTKWSATKWCG